MVVEDEFTAFEKLDVQDEIEFGIRLSDIRVPTAETDDELRLQMYVRIGER